MTIPLLNSYHCFHKELNFHCEYISVNQEGLGKIIQNLYLSTKTWRKNPGINLDKFLENHSTKSHFSSQGKLMTHQQTYFFSFFLEFVILLLIVILFTLSLLLDLNFEVLEVLLPKNISPLIVCFIFFGYLAFTSMQLLGWAFVWKSLKEIIFSPFGKNVVEFWALRDFSYSWVNSMITSMKNYYLLGYY